jgi:hypothetical protein
MLTASLSGPQIKRINMAIPVFIYGAGDDGQPFQELTRTLFIYARGGLIELESPVVKGLRVLAVNEDSDEKTACYVVSTQKSDGRKTRVEIVFDKPLPHFWGIERSIENTNPDRATSTPARQFINNGATQVTAESYRKLMGRKN